MIVVTDTIAIRDDEVGITYILAGGPGGQNVNKLSTAAQLRFDARNSPSLPGFIRARLEKIAGSRLTKNGIIVITANRYRTQEANRRDAIDRLCEMIRQASVKRKYRIPTKPSAGAKKRRLEAKSKRSGVKRLRSRKIGSDD